MLRLGVRAGRFFHGNIGFAYPKVVAHYARGGIRTSASHGESDDSESLEGVSINWYEQTYPGSPNRRRVDPTREDGGENSEEARLIRAKIEELEAEIADLSGENKPSLMEPLIATLSEEEQAKVRKALAEVKFSGEDEQALFEQDVALMDLPKLAKLGTKLGLSSQQTVYLTNLDKRLREAADDITNVSCRNKLWKAFDTAKRNLPPFLHLAPSSIYKVLFESERNADDVHRPTHVRVIATEWLGTGEELAKAYALLYIDSLIELGQTQEARVYWESEKERLFKDEDTHLAFGSLGVRLFADSEKPEQAQALALTLLPRSKQDFKASILLPALVAWAKKGDEDSVKKAWTLYIRLRQELGTNIRVEDYNKIILSFINCGQINVALAVFKDLMLCGQVDRYNSIELYNAALGIIGDMQSRSADSTQLNHVSLTALIAMPQRFQNKFFYGSWLKLLIGNGELDAAASVVELMMERGVKPDAKHLNGMIGAWLRNGNAEARVKADRLAWSMIHSRLDFVRERQGLATVQDTPGKIVPNSAIKSNSLRNTPPATIETFCLLLLDYERRGLQKQVDVLKATLSRAEIRPNTYWMNHLMYAELRGDRHDLAWNVFVDRPRYILPDTESFACLWDCEKRHLDKTLANAPRSFPGPRRLLNEMLSWYSNLGQGARREVRESASKELYDQIIRCMCLSHDLEGTIVALYALKEIFQFYPDSDTARLVALQVARRGIDGGAPRPSRRRRAVAAQLRSSDNLGKTMQMLQTINEQRAETLRQQGVDLDTFNEERKGQEMIIVLAKFLHMVMLKIAEDSDLVLSKVNSAAEEIGLPLESERLKLITAQ